MNQEKKVINMQSYVTKARDLDVYQKAFSISLEIHKLTQSLPKYEQYELASQMRRASKSICANLAEGFAKQKHSAPEFKRFIYIAIGSSEEMQVWLEYCLKLGYVQPNQYETWTEGYQTVTRMLYGLHDKVKSS